MIDFACKKFSLEEVIRCSFNLSKAEFEVFRALLNKKNTDLSTNDLQEATKLDLSTVQRAVKKLYDQGLLQRMQANLSGGGYVFSYKIKSRGEIRGKIVEIVNNWAKRVEVEFDKW